MRSPLYFHLRKDVMTGRDMTFCVDETEKGLVVGHALVHKNDIFNKKTGRKIAYNRMMAAKHGKDTICNCFQLHPAVESNLNKVIQRAGEITKKFGEIEVTLLNHHNGRKVPVTWGFEIKEKE